MSLRRQIGARRVMSASGMHVLARGLARRRGSNAAVFVVALVAAAAAAIGPAYYAAAQTSIARDTVAGAAASSRGIEVRTQTSPSDTLARSRSLTQDLIGRVVPAHDPALEPAIHSIEGVVVLPDGSGTTAGIVSRSDVCAHVTFLRGRCPRTIGEVVISSSVAFTTEFPIGKQFVSPSWGRLTVVGVYAVPDTSRPYWFGRGATYFRTEEHASGRGPDVDTLFTPEATMTAGRQEPQVTVVVDRLLDPAAVHPADLRALSAGVQRLQRVAATDSRLVAVSDLPGLEHDIRVSWHALAVSILFVTVELLALVWLVMFTVIGDAIAARGPEIALMKVRGRRGWGLLAFGLGEPLALLALALPAGVGLGALACLGLDSVLLRPGTPSPLPWTAWLAALVATAGGLGAGLVAGRRTLRRGVLEQWRHATREATRRGWLVDAVVLTAAGAAVVELIVGGQVTSSHSGTLALLVPGVLGLAVAVVASRLLPWLCRRAFAATRRRGGLGAFLAVRQVARRSAGARTTIVLAAAFALATFAIAAWSTGQGNRRLAADVQVGAPTVFTVVPPTRHRDLGAVVDRVDPHGTRAAVVDSYFPGAGSFGTMLAVDPQRFAHVAGWHREFASQSLTSLMDQLAPRASSSVPLDGDEIRVRLTAHALTPTGVVLGVSLNVPGQDGAVTPGLGRIERSSGAVSLSTGLGGCPCTLRSIDLSTTTAGTGALDQRITGRLTLNGIDVHDARGWHALARLQQASRWRELTGTDVDPVQHLSVSGRRLVWPVDVSATGSASLAVADTPVALPAVVSRTLPSGALGSVVPTLGLDGNQVNIRSLARTTAVPGAPAGGVIVDRTYAERAAAGVLSSTVAQQVWATAGARAAVAAGLRRAGVRIVDIQSAGHQADLLDRQGPGLAGSVLLTDALAAVLLAAGGALAALTSAARRRRSEYAALSAAGASRRSLYAGLLIEQAAVLVFGAVVGVVAGIAATLLALRSVPEFVQPPASVVLQYPLPVPTLTVFVAGALGVLAVLAAVTSAGLLAGASTDQLREIDE